MKNQSHIPVLLNEVISYLKPESNQNFIDCTFGAAGHSAEILKRIGPSGKLLVIDLDKENLEKSLKSLGDEGKLVSSFHGNFRDIDLAVEESGFGPVNGILYDLGFSSMQMDGERGFSFSSTERLDMRFNKSQALTAYDIVNEWSDKDLIKIIREYGEERFARQIVSNILKARKMKAIENGVQLAEVIERAVPRRLWPNRIHVATKTFQALRIAVNDEMKNIEVSLPKAVNLLARGGRIAVISFHSIEDRIVKDFFREQVRSCVCPPALPKCVCDTKPTLKIITKKIIEATEAEINSNPRARSAKLRVAEKL